MRFKLFLCFIGAAFFVSCASLKDGAYSLDILSTNDVQGRWFDESFAGGRSPRGSLFSAYSYIKGVRDTSQVLLIDAGDAMQGAAANFYFNYADTLSPHIFPRIASYMAYDAFIPGPDEIQGGLITPRVKKDFRKMRVPVVTGDNFVILKKGGLKIAVLSSMGALEKVKKHNPNLVVLKSHAKEIPQNLEGIDFLLSAHDHKALAEMRGKTCILNAGSYAKNLGHGNVLIEVKGGKVVSKKVSGKCPSINKEKAEASIKEAFKADLDKINEFVQAPLGLLDKDVPSVEAYKGASSYMNIYHSLALSQPYVDISMCSPLVVNDVLKAGEISYNSIPKLYPYENKLVVIRMTGKEIVSYLERCYDTWIQTINSADDNILKMKRGKDIKTGAETLNFANSPANFESAAGINYTVDVTKPAGSRVNVLAMADGINFSLEESYNVGITSYRATGAGGLLASAGIDPKKLDERIVKRGPEFQTLLYKYLKSEGGIDTNKIDEDKKLGSWKFIPEDIAKTALERDLNSIFVK